MAAALVLAVGVIAGGVWYVNRPVPVEEVDVPVPAASSQPEEEPPVEEVPEETPVDPFTLEDDELIAYLSQLSDEELKEYEEELERRLDEGLKKLIEETTGKTGEEAGENEETGDPSAAEQPEGSQPAQEQSGGVPPPVHMTPEEVGKLLDEAGISWSWGNTDGGPGAADIGDAVINW